MNSCASVAVLEESLAGAPPQPLVLLDGIPEPRLVVSQWQASGACDRRRALLRFDASANGPLLQRWLNQTVSVALPVRLSDDQCRWIVLLHGRGNHLTTEAGEARDANDLEVIDDWDRLLDQPIQTLWWQIGQGDQARLLAQSSTAAARLGGRARRSERTWRIGVEEVFVFQDGGAPWTLATVLGSLSAMAGLALTTTLIPPEIAHAPLLTEIATDHPIGLILARLLDEYGLAVVREWEGNSGHWIERRSVQPVARGRRIGLTIGALGRQSRAGLHLKATESVEFSRRWEACGENRLIESTFTLTPGWDPVLEGRADSCYSRQLSPDFTTYANVYRFWALNEDGRFTENPYQRGPAFDLGAFFGTGPQPQQARRFLPCLTLDDSGCRRPPVVEIRVDAGMSWSLYPGLTSVATDRAAIHLEDSTLPTAFLTAAKAGTARVRVTATLENPQPTTAQRWQGNPFTRLAPDLQFDLSHTMLFRNIDGRSIFFSAVRNGSLQADEKDDSAALRRWLVQRMQQDQRRSAALRGRATLTLAGPWPALRPGDQLVSQPADIQDELDPIKAVLQAGASVRQLMVRWPVECSDRGSPEPACTTEIQLQW